MSYIQNKLDIIDIFDYIVFEDGDIDKEKSNKKLKELITDYNNHIVEKMHEHVENMYHPGTWEYNECGDFVNSFYEKINLLQDTNK